MDISQKKPDYLSAEATVISSQAIYLALLNCGRGDKVAAIVLSETETGFFDKYSSRDFAKQYSQQRFSGYLMVDPTIARTAQM